MLIRTYYTNGLLFYISNLQESAFIAIQLVNDELSVIYSPNMQLVSAINSDAHVTDGAWHTVSQFAFLSGSVNNILCTSVS